MIIISNIAKLKYAALDITEKNYLSWILDVEIYLHVKFIGNMIVHGNKESN